MFNRWNFFDRFRLPGGETLGDFLFSYYHPMLSMMMGPIVMLILFVCMLWPIVAVGRNGIIPAAILIGCIVLMHLLYNKTSNIILFVWMQPVICHTQFLFTKYAWAENANDPGVGIFGWLTFAVIALLVLVYTVFFLELDQATWTVVYLILYGEAWILFVTHPEYVYYVVSYMVFFALMITIFISLMRLKKKESDSDAIGFLLWVLLFATAVFSYVHPMLTESMSPGFMQGIHEILHDPDAAGFLKFFAGIIKFFLTCPVTRVIGTCIRRFAMLLMQFS